MEGGWIFGYVEGLWFFLSHSMFSRSFVSFDNGLCPLSIYDPTSGHVCLWRESFAPVIHQITFLLSWTFLFSFGSFTEPRCFPLVFHQFLPEIALFTPFFPC